MSELPSLSPVAVELPGITGWSGESEDELPREFVIHAFDECKPASCEND